MTTLGIIGGSIAGFLEAGRQGLADDSGPVDTDWGSTSGPLLSRETRGHRVVFLARHGSDSTIPPHAINYRANIAALAAAGCDAVIALNAVGGIAAEAETGMLAVPHQLIDYTWGRAHSYYDGSSAELTFADFTSPYDSNLRSALIAACAAADVEALGSGVYAATQGPRLESAAEIDRLERDGCTLVGMTGMPEAGLAREKGLPYASLCQIVNRAAGRGTGGIHAEIEAALRGTAAQTGQVIETLLEAL